MNSFVCVIIYTLPQNAQTHTHTQACTEKIFGGPKILIRVIARF